MVAQGMIGGVEALADGPQGSKFVPLDVVEGWESFSLQEGSEIEIVGVEICGEVEFVDKGVDQLLKVAQGQLVISQGYPLKRSIFKFFGKEENVANQGFDRFFVVI